MSRTPLSRARRGIRAPRLAPAVVAVVGVVSTACLAGGCGSSGRAPSADPATHPPATPSSSAGASPATPSPSTPAETTRATRPTAPVTAAPAGGPVLRGPGYRLRAPQGWRDLTAQVRQLGVDQAAGAPAPVHGFTSNVNVVVSGQDFRMRHLDQVTRQVRDRLLPSAPGYAILPRAHLAGTPAGHLAGVRTNHGTRYWLTQYVTAHGGHSYVVSFSFSPRVPAGKRQRLVAAMLSTWHWRG